MTQILIGTRIREERRKRSIKQADLATAVKISPAYLNLIEHNKRNIGGELLNSIAARLELPRSFFAETVSTESIERAQQSARALSLGAIEMDRFNEFITLFPGFAKLLDRQIQLSQIQADQVAVLSDQLEHDVVLRETLHIMLSNITAIRSTAEILLMHGGIADDQRHRFNQNIFTESKRLTHTTIGLLDHFVSDVPISGKTPIAPEISTSPNFDFFGQYEPMLEPHNGDIEGYLETLKTASPAASEADHVQRHQRHQRHQHRQWASTYHRIAGSISLDSLAATRRHHQFDPFVIAEQTGLDIADIFFRLAHLPKAASPAAAVKTQNAAADLAGSTAAPAINWPEFGYLAVDNSGGVLARKELPVLRLPSRSGACPRWPIYRAFAASQQAISAELDQLGAPLVMAHAIALPQRQHSIGLPPVTQALMIFRAMPSDLADRRSVVKLDVGFHCSVCARLDCTDRRVNYTLNQ